MSEKVVKVLLSDNADAPAIPVSFAQEGTKFIVKIDLEPLAMWVADKALGIYEGREKDK